MELEVTNLFGIEFILLFVGILIGLPLLEWLLQKHWVNHGNPAHALPRLKVLTGIAMLWYIPLALLLSYACFNVLEDLTDITSPWAYAGQVFCTLLPVAGVAWLTWRLWKAHRAAPGLPEPDDAQRALLIPRLTWAIILCIFVGSSAGELFACLFETPDLPHLGNGVQEYLDLLATLRAGPTPQAVGMFQLVAGIFSAICGLVILRLVFKFDPQVRRFRVVRFSEDFVWYVIGTWFLANVGLHGIAAMMLELPQASAVRVPIMPMKCVVSIAFSTAIYLVLVTESEAIVRARRMHSWTRAVSLGGCRLGQVDNIAEARAITEDIEVR